MKEANVRVYIGVLTSLALSLAASWIYWYGFDVEASIVLATVVFGTLLCVVGRYPIKVSESREIDATDIILVFSVVVLGPVWTTFAALPYAVLVGRRDFLRTLYEAGQNTLMFHLAGIVFLTAADDFLLAGVGSVSAAVYGSVAAAVVMTASNCLIDAALLKIKYQQDLGDTWRDQIEPYLFSDFINLLTVGIGVLALSLYGPVAAIVAVSGATVSQILVYQTRENVQENRELKARISSLEESLDVVNLTFGAMMIEDLGRQDGYTHFHAAATAVYSADIAGEMDFEESVVAKLRMAGLLHNIGMFGAPRELLIASANLNSIAKTRIYEHPEIGERALASVPEFSELAKWVRWHHERPDGRGYPDRLRAAWIPLEARILSVSQAYAAMVLDQPRRPGVSPAAAREELNHGAGKQFDEVVVRAFLRILDTETEGYRAADDHRFGFRTTRNLAVKLHDQPDERLGGTGE